MELWRVFNWAAGADPGENGHPLFVWPRQGAGRVDDPDHDYLVLYVGDSPEGATAEAFGRFARWTPDILDVPFTAPAGMVKALAKFEGNPTVLNLDDPYVLQDIGLRPSGVVSRDRSVTQQWARGIHDTGDHHGMSWWSYYEPQWSSFGLWDLSELSLAQDPEVLSMGHPAVGAAASAIRRVVTDQRV